MTSVERSRTIISEIVISWAANKITTLNQSSFPVIHEVDNVHIFVLLNFDKKLHTVISHFRYNS